VHAPAIAECPDVTFAGVWARGTESARALAEKHGVQAYEHLNELLRACDAVAFAVPPVVQAELGAFAAQAKKAVLLEVPIGGDQYGAEALTEAVLLNKVVSQVALTWRYTTAVRTFLATEVPRTHPQGGVGRVVVRARDRFVSPWWMERGVLFGVGPHLVDLLDAALGPVAIVRAHGEPDGWLGMLLEHGHDRFSEASLLATTGDEPIRAGVEIFGPGGAASVDPAAGVGPDTWLTMYREFAAAVQSGTPHELDVQRGLHVHHIVEEADTDLVRRAENTASRR
jgi:predicted dehydrogenase